MVQKQLKLWFGPSLQGIITEIGTLVSSRAVDEKKKKIIMRNTRSVTQHKGENGKNTRRYTHNII